MNVTDLPKVEMGKKIHELFLAFNDVNLSLVSHIVYKRMDFVMAVSRFPFFSLLSIVIK